MHMHSLFTSLEMMLIPLEVQEITIKPLMQHPSISRPRKQRIPSARKKVVRRMCSICHQRGHNHGTCRNPIPFYPNQ